MDDNTKNILYPKGSIFRILKDDIISAEFKVAKGAIAEAVSDIEVNDKYAEVCCNGETFVIETDIMGIILTKDPIENKSVKNDIIDDKLRWDLLPMEEIEDIVRVYHAGAKRLNLMNKMNNFNNINYAAKTRRAYLINNFDKILNSLNTLHSTVETMTLFVNDQAYNYILKLKEVIKGGPMYKHNIKRLLNDMDKEIKRYNASIYYINKERSEVIADITQAMEDCLMPYIDDLAGAIRAAVWSKGVSEERTEAAVLSLIVSSLAMTSGRLISGGYQIMKEMGGGWGGNPFTFMSIDKIRHLSTSLSDAITGGEIALEEKEANDITKAMDVFIEKMSDSDIVDKVINILEEAESKNKEEQS